MRSAALLLASLASCSAYNLAGALSSRPAVRAARGTPASMVTPTEEKKSAVDIAKDFFGVVEPTPNAKAVAKVEEKEDKDNLMQQVKDAGPAGILSYIIWEWVFWIGAAGIAAFGFYTVQGHLPDLTSDADKGAVAAEAFAIVNVARFAVPLRIGLALGTTPWVKENIVDKFSKDCVTGLKSWMLENVVLMRGR